MSNVKRYKKANTLEENHAEFKKSMQIVQWGLTYLKNNKGMPNHIRNGAYDRASMELWRLMRRLIDLERDYKELKKELEKSY